MQKRIVNLAPNTVPPQFKREIFSLSNCRPSMLVKLVERFFASRVSSGRTHTGLRNVSRAKRARKPTVRLRVEFVGRNPLNTKLTNRFEHFICHSSWLTNGVTPPSHTKNSLTRLFFKCRLLQKNSFFLNFFFRLICSLRSSASTFLF